MGGELADKEELEQFHPSLPASYNDVRKWFPAEQKMYDNLKRQVLEDSKYCVRESRGNESSSLLVQSDCDSSRQSTDRGNIQS